MILFYRKKNCPVCNEIEEALTELVIAHRTIEVDGSVPVHPPLPDGATPPVIVDGQSVIQRKEELFRYLSKLARFKEEWDRFQSDSCYCGEDGEVE